MVRLKAERSVVYDALSHAPRDFPSLVVLEYLVQPGIELVRVEEALVEDDRASGGLSGDGIGSGADSYRHVFGLLFNV